MVRGSGWSISASVIRSQVDHRHSGTLTARLPEMTFESPEVGAKALKSLLDRDRNFASVSVDMD